ncbi:hypothetical protein Plec18167_003962 [Paecilomyces lecythidis]|uniref:Nineteen complex-related protein 2-domain-containing protein n=1 Tax=Paecilomyces lecythidis TaxID=3004212 RepID=A0ABR3XU44_9EURO
MSSLFKNRNKARRVGPVEEEEENGTAQDVEPVVKRPTKSKQKSKLRLSFGPGETSMAEDEDQSEVVTPKRPGLGRRALEKSALQRSWSPSGSSDHLPIRVGQDQGRPVYNQDYLKELRDSTPSTPKQQSSVQSDEETNKGVDVAAKFGEVIEISRPTSIPSEAEIREKKARRARLAKEQDFISLDDGDEEEEDYLSLDPKREKEETRLVPDDEDFAEGFDEYVEDGRISLGKKAEREQQRRKRAEMRDLIEEAEDTSDEDDSDAERKAAYEAAQTRAAMGLDHVDHPERPKTPPKITSLPRLADSLTRLRTSLATMEVSKSQLINRMEELRKEKADIATREVEIQALIKEAGENYERLRAEAGLNPDAEAGLPGDEIQNYRGLESLGTSMASPNAASENET